MSRPDCDPDLARRFAALRRAEEPAAPPFRPLWAAAGRRRHGSELHLLRLAAAGAAVVAAALLAAWLVARRVPAGPSPGAVPSLVEWRSPTDFLLRTPGQELLETPPSLGRGFAIEPGASLPSTTTDRRSS